MAKKKAECVECGKLRTIMGRGLCGTCYGKPEVKAKHPSKWAGTGKKAARPAASMAKGVTATRRSRLPRLIQGLIEELVSLAEDSAKEADECVKIVEGYADRVRRLRLAFLKLRDRTSKVGDRFGGADEEAVK